MSKLNNTGRPQGLSSFACTHSAAATSTPLHTDELNHMLTHEYEAAHDGMCLAMEVSFDRGKCSNSADLPSTPN